MKKKLANLALEFFQRGEEKDKRAGNLRVKKNSAPALLQNAKSPSPRSRVRQNLGLSEMREYSPEIYAIADRQGRIQGATGLERALQEAMTTMMPAANRFTYAEEQRHMVDKITNPAVKEPMSAERRIVLKATSNAYSLATSTHTAVTDGYNWARKAYGEASKTHMKSPETKMPRETRWNNLTHTIKRENPQVEQIEETSDDEGWASVTSNERTVKGKCSGKSIVSEDEGDWDDCGPKDREYLL